MSAQDNGPEKTHSRTPHVLVKFQDVGAERRREKREKDGKSKMLVEFSTAAREARNSEGMPSRFWKMIPSVELCSWWTISSVCCQLHYQECKVSQCLPPGLASPQDGPMTAVSWYSPHPATHRSRLCKIAAKSMERLFQD